MPFVVERSEPGAFTGARGKATAGSGPPEAGSEGSITMESAIPAHLRTARTRTRRIPDDYCPPYPSYVARHRPAVQQVVMA